METAVVHFSILEATRTLASVTRCCVDPQVSMTSCPGPAGLHHNSWFELALSSASSSFFFKHAVQWQSCSHFPNNLQGLHSLFSGKTTRLSLASPWPPVGRWSPTASPSTPTRSGATWSSTPEATIRGGRSTLLFQVCQHRTIYKTNLQSMYCGLFWMILLFCFHCKLRCALTDTGWLIAVRWVWMMFMNHLQFQSWLPVFLSVSFSDDRCKWNVQWGFNASTSPVLSYVLNGLSWENILEMIP